MIYPTGTLLFHEGLQQLIYDLSSWECFTMKDQFLMVIGEKVINEQERGICFITQEGKVGWFIFDEIWKDKNR